MNPKTEPYWLKGLSDGFAHQRAAEATQDPVLAWVLDARPVYDLAESYTLLAAAARRVVFAEPGTADEAEALARLGYIMATVVDEDEPMKTVRVLASRRPKWPWRERCFRAWLALRYGR